MVYTLTLDPTSWLAMLTGETTVTIYTNGDGQELNKTTLAEGFNGFFFKVNGALVLFADARAFGRAPASPARITDLN
jgi:hypothetical protein